MKNINKILIIVISILILIFTSGIVGYKLNTQNINVYNDTIVYVDTVRKKIIDTTWNNFIDTTFITDHNIVTDTFTYYDTVKVINDYFKINKYSKNWTDSAGLFNLIAFVSENKIKSTEFSYKLFKKTSVITNNKASIVDYNRYLSGGVDFNLNDINDVKIGLLYTNKNITYNIGYKPFKDQITFGIYWHIFKW